MTVFTTGVSPQPICGHGAYGERGAARVFARRLLRAHPAGNAVEVFDGNDVVARIHLGPINVSG